MKIPGEMGFVEARRGLPRLAQRLREGAPVTVVAFGTSMTYDGHYLEHVTARLEARSSGSCVRLERVGLRQSLSSWASYRVVDRVVPLAPDLVLLEFAINDAFYTEHLENSVASAMHGIIAQIHAALPACEFAFVHLASTKVSPGGVRTVIAAHDAVAAHYGFPSFDLAALSEELVASGAMDWYGTERALTRDRVHHTPLAARVLGIPFAEALGEVAFQAQPVLAFPDPIPSPYAGARRVAATDLIARGAWLAGPADGDLADFRDTAMVSDAVAVANEPGSALRLAFEGSLLMLWVYTADGEITIRSGGQAIVVRIEAQASPCFKPVLVPLPPGRHELEIVATKTPVIYGDVFLIGERVGA